MIQNYIKIAYRNLIKEKGFSVINLLGLTIAFAAAIMLYLTADYHFSYDDMHAKRDNTYKIYRKVNRPASTEYGTTIAPPMIPTLKSEYKDEIVSATRIMDSGTAVEVDGKMHTLDINYVDKDYLDIFESEVIAGTKNDALSQINGITLRSKTAIKIFGSTDPIGKTLLLQRGETPVPLVVQAVLADLPRNSTIENSNLMRFEMYDRYEEAKDSWGWQNHSGYVKLADNVNWEQFELKMKSFTEKYFPNELELAKKSGFVPDDRNELISTRLLPFSEEHFNVNLGSGAINYFYPLMLLAIALLIVLIASINFINLSVGRSLTRAKEVGMRKALGAMKAQLIGQFWGEALIMCVISLVFGLVTAYFLIPEFNAIVNGNIEFADLLQPKVAFVLVLGFVLITAIAGGYPAWIISKFNTVEVLKGKVNKGRSGASLRNTLMVLQFAISMLLIVSTLVVWQQLDYLKNKPLGYNREQVVSIPVGKGIDGYKLLNFYRNELATNTSVVSISGADNNLGSGKDGNGYKSVFGFGIEEKEYLTNGLNIDFDYIETLDLKLVAGRSFDRKFTSDSNSACVINETMAKQLGGVDKALGMKLPLDGEKEVIGIVQDYHFESLRDKVASNTLFFNPDFGINYIFIKTLTNNPVATMGLLEKTYQKYKPDGIYQGSYLTANTQNQYSKESRISSIFTTAAILAIFLSCIGLFAVALLMIKQRTKEIGVRKVLGADVSTLVTLLSKDYLVLIFIAGLVACPLAYYFMQEWLEEFPYRIAIQPYIFIAAGLGMMLIASLTIAIHVVKAAYMNPVNSLKSE